MAKKEAPDVKKYVFWAILAVLIILSYIILKSYLISIVSAFILAYLILPFYKYLEKKTSKTISAIICISIILIVIIVSFSIIIGNIINQAYTALDLEALKAISSYIVSQPLLQKIGLNFNIFEKGISLIISLIGSIITQIPMLITSLIIITFGVYFMLVNWAKISLALRDYIPFKNKDKFLKEIAQTTDGIVYGYILIAILQFIVSFIGFYIIGIKLYALLATIIFFLALIPFIGPAFVWIPLLIYHIVIKDYTTAAYLFILGLVLSAFLDSLFRIKITGEKAKINSFVMLLGIIGGVPIFGIFGFILGPMILSYTLKLFKETLK